MQTAAHPNTIQVACAHFHFALSSLSSSSSDFGPIILTSSTSPPQSPPTRTDVRHGRISLLSGVLCRPVVSDPSFNLEASESFFFFSPFFFSAKPSALPHCFPPHMHGPLRGRPSRRSARGRRRWRRRLSHSCSGFDPSPLTSAPSHGGQAPS